MSVETKELNHNNGDLNATKQEQTETTASLTMPTFPKRNGRKRTTPQKAVATEEESDEESSSDGASKEENSKVIENGVAEDTNSKAKSILEHYRSFMQRNLPDSSNEVDKRSAKQPRLTKSKSLEDTIEEDKNLEDDYYLLDPVVKGLLKGSNGIIPERTMRQNIWAIKVWRDWALTRNRKPETKLEKFPEVPVDIRAADVKEISYWLPKFITEVRRKDKKAYPAETLMQIASGLQRYLRQVSCRSEVNFFDKYSKTFAEFRDALKSRSGELYVEAQASKVGKQVKLHSLNDEQLWQSGYLNCSTAKGIFHVMFYYNCVEFEIASMEEHHELKSEQFGIALDKTKKEEYIEFTRSNQRYYNMSPKQTLRRYASKSDKQCLVNLYKLYLYLIPSTGPFYRRPLQTPENSSPRFSFNPVGINKLRETYKQIFPPDRPACLRKSGKTTAVRYMSQTSNEQDNASPPPVSYTINKTSQAVYDDITQKLKSGGHLRPSDDAVDRSAKTSDSFESDPEEEATPLSAEDVMEQIRKSWHTAREEGNHDFDDVTNKSDDDDTLTIKVPRCVKRIVVEREGKKMKYDLN